MVGGCAQPSLPAMPHYFQDDDDDDDHLTANGNATAVEAAAVYTLTFNTTSCNTHNNEPLSENHPRPIGGIETTP